MITNALAIVMKTKKAEKEAEQEGSTVSPYKKPLSGCGVLVNARWVCGVAPASYPKDPFPLWLWHLLPLPFFSVQTTFMWLAFPKRVLHISD